MEAGRAVGPAPLVDLLPADPGPPIAVEDVHHATLGHVSEQVIRETGTQRQRGRLLQPDQISRSCHAWMIGRVCGGVNSCFGPSAQPTCRPGGLFAHTRLASPKGRDTTTHSAHRRLSRDAAPLRVVSEPTFRPFAGELWKRVVAEHTSASKLRPCSLSATTVCGGRPSLGRRPATAPAGPPQHPPAGRPLPMPPARSRGRQERRGCAPPPPRAPQSPSQRAPPGPRAARRASRSR